MSPKQAILRRAKSILRNTGWTRGAFARDSSGRNLGLGGVLGPERAASYCILGALKRASNELRLSTPLSLEVAVQRATVVGPFSFNDYKAADVHDVLRVLDDAEHIRIPATAKKGA